jgi:hypothetical protein
MLVACYGRNVQCTFYIGKWLRCCFRMQKLKMDGSLGTFLSGFVRLGGADLG